MTPRLSVVNLYSTRSNSHCSILLSCLAWGGTEAVWSSLRISLCLWPPSSEAVAQRLYIIRECTQKHRLKEHAANSTETHSEAESSCSNTMIVCLSLPVVRALHQPTALMTACHTKVAHLPSKHTGKKRFFFFFFFFLSFIFKTSFYSFCRFCPQIHIFISLSRVTVPSKSEKWKTEIGTKTKRKWQG